MSTTHAASPRRFFVALGTAASLILGAATAEAQDITGERALLNRTSAPVTSHFAASNAVAVDGAVALLGFTARRAESTSSSAGAVAPAIDGAVALLGRRAVRIGSSASVR